MKNFIVIIVFGMLGCGVADEERLYYSAEQKQWGIAASGYSRKIMTETLFRRVSAQRSERLAVRRGQRERREGGAVI